MGHRSGSTDLYHRKVLARYIQDTGGVLPLEEQVACLPLRSGLWYKSRSLELALKAKLYQCLIA